MATPQWEAFQNGLPIGIDLKRSVIGRNLGVYVVNETTTFRAGMVVSLNAAQELIRSTGASPLGFAKYDKTTAMYQTIVDEAIVLNAAVASNLAHSNLLAAPAIKVADAAGATATSYTVTTDYTVSTTNGTVTRNATGGIGDGDTVYCTYIYEIPTSEMQFEGKNFYNSLDDTEYNDSRMTVITDWSIVFTTAYDVAGIYAVNDVVYAGATADTLEGYVTEDTTGTAIGTVFQTPSATDPFLGVKFTG